MSEKTTKEHMLDKAFELFHRNGVPQTSVDSILESSGTGKSQFYYYFEDKEDIVRQVLARFQRRVLGGQMPGSFEVHTIEDLTKWFEAFGEFLKDTKCLLNCPIATIGTDIGSDQKALRREVQSIFQSMRSGLVS